MIYFILFLCVIYFFIIRSKKENNSTTQEQTNLSDIPDLPDKTDLSSETEKLLRDNEKILRDNQQLSSDFHKLNEKYLDLLNDYSCLSGDYNNLDMNLRHLQQSYSSHDRDNYTDLLRKYNALCCDYDKLGSQLKDLQQEYSSLKSSYNISVYNNKKLQYKEEKHRHFIETLEHSDNLTGFPYIASFIADIKTAYLQNEIYKSQEKRAISLVELKNKLKDTIAAYNVIKYQLDYLKCLYPGIEDLLETSYRELTFDTLENLDNDPIRNYLSAAEYKSLSESERNQLALDNYVQSRQKNNWQIGRDYELFIGYTYQQKGYEVDFYGSNMKLEDLGRDLIAKRAGEILIIQCKYWSKEKIIHENHIAQLYGTTISYCIENNIRKEFVKPIFITSTTLSEQAHKFCDYLDVEYQELVPIDDFPRIKCNIGKDEYGNKTKIYHLPMDQQYDNVKLNSPGEFMAFTVDEAESKGFRRAYKWHR